MQKPCFIYLFLLLTALNVSAETLTYRFILAKKKIVSTPFTCPLLDDDDLNIVPATCGGSDGAILGIRANSVTGTPSFTWRNANGDIVGSQSNLTGVPSGSYTVTLTDDSKCKAVTSAPYIVGIKNQVTINDQNIQITKPTCNNPDGSITGIIVTNAVQYQWTNSSGKVVATTASLTNAIADTYTLTSTNAAGCSATKIYTLPSATSTPKISDTQINNANCNSTGSVVITFDLSATDPPYHYGLQENGKDVDIQTGYILYIPNSPTTVTLSKLAPGVVYNLYSIDAINCRTKIASYTIKPSPGFSIGADSAVFHPDVCGQHVGAIIGLSILGGARPHPRNQPKEGYFWRDSTGKQIASTLYLAGVAAGTYILTVKNGDGCIASREFVIKDSTSVAIPPQVNDIKLCLPQTVTIPVKNPGTGTGYRLYNADSTLLKESKYPFFAEKIAETAVFYLTTLNGTCESAKTKLIITVALPGLNIPNTFTPNNDGINDYWDIKGVEQYPGTELFIYNRNGQTVYHAVNYSQPFNGNYNNKPLPAGVYYYIIDPKKSECQGRISGSLTIIR